MSNLFSEFEPVSAKEWKQKIQYDLKGADYNETLVWQSLEGINVKPFYHRDDFKHRFPPIPGQPNSWNIAQRIFIDDEKIAKKLALDSINRGAEAILFEAKNEFDMKAVFEAFPFEKAIIYFEFHFLSEAFLTTLQSFLSQEKASVFYNIDIIGNLAKTGNWFKNLKSDHSVLDSIVSKNPEKNNLSVNLALYQNAGANMVQQLAYTLAHVNEYFNHFQGNSITTLQINFNVSVGSNYFFEIAKIRALRKLYAVLAAEYNAPTFCHIMVQPSKRNKTIYDYNVNMLRTTTEAMSAVLGGANTVCNVPYDALYHKSNEFGERISRNQLLILKHESYFDTVANPSDGTYYIEALTEELAEKALLLFKEIENGGGFLQQLKEGKIQKKISESAQKEQQLFDAGKLVLLGTNKYPNEADRMSNDLELFPFMKMKSRKTLLQPIITNRLSENLEKNRLKNETP